MRPHYEFLCILSVFLLIDFVSSVVIELVMVVFEWYYLKATFFFIS